MSFKSLMNLIFRADANSQIGTGHLMRCLALAQGWKTIGGTVIFITNCESGALRQRLQKEGFAVIGIQNSYPHPSDWQTMQEVLKRYPNTWCVVDGYNFNAEFHRLIRRNGNPLLIVDDMAHLPFYDADIILNQNVTAERLHYNCAPNTELLLGAQYILLRREFEKWRGFIRSTPPLARRVLLTMGGSDPQNITGKVIEALLRVDVEQTLDITVVIGGSNKNHTRLQALVFGQKVRNQEHNVRFLFNVENMPELISETDLAIIAAGGTLWEMLFMKTPILSFSITDFQAQVIEALENLKLVQNLGKIANTNFAELENILVNLIKSLETRKQMVLATSRLMDGLGVERVINILRTEQITSI